MKLLILEGLHGNNKGKRMQWRLKRTNLKVGDRVVLDCHDWKIIKIVKQKKKKPSLKVYSDVSIGVPGNLVISYSSALKRKENAEITQVDGGESYWGYISENNLDDLIKTLTKELRIATKKAKGKQIKKLMELVDERKLKELHNRPYFKTIVTEIKGKPNRGENLEKIKFPCWCAFDHRKGIFGGKQGVHGIGKIDKIAEDGQVQYQLSWADRQMGNSGVLDILVNLSVLCTTPSLKRLMELYDIEILKGELKLWKEVK